MEVEWRESNPSLQFAMNHILETGLYSDVTFSVGPEAFKLNAHKVILQSRSEFFAFMLNDRWVQKQEENAVCEIEVLDYSPEAFKHFLKYFYTDAFPSSMDVTVALELMKLSHSYQVHGLFTKCSKFLKDKISIDTCIRIYQQTSLYETLSLSQDAFSFMMKNITVIVENEEFENLDFQTLNDLLRSDEINVKEIVLFRAVLRWANTESRKESLQVLIPNIRFPIMDSEDFATDVCSSGVLTKDEMLDMFLYFNIGKPIEKFSTKPRKSVIQINDVNLKYFITRHAPHMSKTRSDQMVLRFTSDTQVKFLGVIFSKSNLKEFLLSLGNDNLKDKDKIHEIPFFIQYEILDGSVIDYAILGVSQVMRLATPGNFDVLLKEPIILNANFAYLIRVFVRFPINSRIERQLNDSLSPAAGTDYEALTSQVYENEFFSKILECNDIDFDRSWPSKVLVATNEANITFTISTIATRDVRKINGTCIERGCKECNFEEVTELAKVEAEYIGKNLRLLCKSPFVVINALIIG